jgi:hypothetical protein
MTKKLQYRTRGTGKHSTRWQWRDLPQEMPNYSGDECLFYWSSLNHQESGGEVLYDIELRFKPEPEPVFKEGYYRRREETCGGGGEGYEIHYIRHEDFDETWDGDVEVFFNFYEPVEVTPKEPNYE